MYGKLYESMYDGTLVETWEALVTFQQMIILCDADGVLDVTPEALHRRTGIPLEIIRAGIAALEAPDPRSRSPEEGGARIVRLDEHRDWGWRLVNHEHYKSLVDSDTKRSQNAERQRRYRERHRNGASRGVTDVTQNNAPSRHKDKDKDTDTENPSVPPNGRDRANSTDIKRVFEHWQSVLDHPRAALDDKRKKLIARQLKHYSADDLCKAIEGCSKTPHNMGDNDRGQRYDDLGLILRDADHIDRFMRHAERPPRRHQSASSQDDDGFRGLS